MVADSVNPERLEAVYQYILRATVAEGKAPHFAEIAREFSLPPETGKADLHGVMNSGIPGWLFPNTDLIAVFPPFSNLHTQYRITVEERQAWSAVWGFEALAVCWHFPGQEVIVDAPCLDCGEPMRVAVKDGVIQSSDPEGIAAYVDVPVAEWRVDLPYTWGRMNLFRSEDHARKWSGFGTESGLMSLDAMMTAMSAPMFRERAREGYLARLPELRKGFLRTLANLTGNDPFWTVPV